MASTRHCCTGNQCVLVDSLYLIRRNKLYPGESVSCCADFEHYGRHLLVAQYQAPVCIFLLYWVLKLLRFVDASEKQFCINLFHCVLITDSLKLQHSHCSCCCLLWPTELILYVLLWGKYSLCTLGDICKDEEWLECVAGCVWQFRTSAEQPDTVSQMMKIHDELYTGALCSIHLLIISARNFILYWMMIKGRSCSSLGLKFGTCKSKYGQDNTYISNYPSVKTFLKNHFEKFGTRET